MGSQQLSVLGLSLLLLACGATFAASQACVDTTSVHLAVFGDSLTDQGRVWRMTNKTIPRADLGYYNGRFTSAYGVWLDYLKGWTEDKTVYTNFAFGGALACAYQGNTRSASVPNLSQQIDIHLGRLPTSGYKSLLSGKQRGAIIWTGHNDFFFFAPQLLKGELNATTFVQNVISCIISGAQTLLDAGETKVVIGTTAPIARTPAAQTQIPAPALPIFAGLLNAFNQGLAQAIQALNAGRSGPGQVYLWDAFTDLDSAFNTFECFGFKTLDSCIHYAPGGGAFQGSNPIGPVCTDPNDRVFWDPFHPSSRAHKRIIAHSIKRRLLSLDLI